MATGIVYAVAGAKGGVGKTTTSLNLGAALAATGRSVVVVELDLAMANVVDFLTLDMDPETDTTLHEVLAGDADIDDAVYDAPGEFSVAPSGTTLDGFASVDVDRLGDVLATLRTRFDVLLLDTGAGLSHETLLPLGLAAETVLVSSPRVASVRDVEKTKQLTERVGGRVAGAVFVRSGTGNSPPVDRIADFLDVPLLGHVPEDEAVPASQDAGRPVVVHAPDSSAAAAYQSIAHELAARDVVDPGSVQAESNAVRARAETAKHRGGFVFPGGETSENDDRPDADRSADERVDDDSRVDSTERESIGEQRGVTADSEAAAEAEEDSRTASTAPDDDASTVAASAIADSTTGSQKLSEDARTPAVSVSTTETDAADRTDLRVDADERDDHEQREEDAEAGLRGRLGSVVRAVRGPF
ncbi:septum site-determining protein MinD [Halogranum rubrum]|uniref:Septum site-determining protein MinD n=1 Tax=Halogranum rubrum TaxID=553466 RepID=A0A1I4EIC5_9EURY|nr:P-loop NTPase [Halogranum rubrum]SFL03901.1 septum site-determining protein MinD [Halogranum rubrum]